MSLSDPTIDIPAHRVTQYLPASPGSANGQFYVGGEIQIEDGGKAYSGYGTYIGGWNNGMLVESKRKTVSKQLHHRRRFHRLLLG